MLSQSKNDRTPLFRAVFKRYFLSIASFHSEVSYTRDYTTLFIDVFRVLITPHGTRLPNTPDQQREGHE